MAAVSYEAALDACRARLGELTYENVLKDAQIRELEAQLAAVQSEAPAAGAPDVARDATTA